MAVKKKVRRQPGVATKAADLSKATAEQEQTKISVSIWETLNARIAPLLGGRSLVGIDDDELRVLAKSAGIQLNALRDLAEAEKLFTQTGIDAALFFALIKAGMGCDLKALLAHAKVRIQKTLQSAVARSVIPRALGPQVDAAMGSLDALRYRYGSLRSAVRGLDLRLPVKFMNVLTERGINSLDELRRAGSLLDLEDLPVAHDDPGLKSLEAAAQFTAISNESTVTAALLRASYKGLADVARSTPREFLNRVEKDLDPAKAAALHDAAKLQMQLVNNHVTGQRVLAMTNRGAVQQKLLKHLPQTCHCCSDALSPIAYLADLLDYTVRNVKYGGTAVTLTFLEQHLHQPFSGLPVTCQDDIETVRQARICIEVLRDMLPPPQKTAAPRFYLDNAYRRLLELSGTSFNEMRAARAMGRSERNELAKRLQILIDPNQTNRPDRLDDLFRDPDAVSPDPLATTEAWLELYFGLRDTARSPLDPPITTSRMLNEKLHYWREQWRSADSRDATCPLGSYPLVDPDIVGMADLTDPTTRNRPANPGNKTTWTALDFLEERQNLLNSALGDLQNARKPTGAPQLTYSQMMLALAQPFTVLGVGVGLTANLIDVNQTDPGLVLKMLLAKRQDTQSGIDISAWLASVKLSSDEFELLSRMADLQVKQLPITESEWADFNSIMVNRAKQEVLAQWRIEERAAQPAAMVPQITLTGLHFQPRPDSGEQYAWTPVPFRSDAAVRRKWERTLRTRIDQEQALQDAAASAIDTVEHDYLEALRDDLLRTTALLGLLGGTGGLLTPARLKWFTNNLLIDGEMSACAMTTRIEQAIETVQGLLFGIRSGLLEDTAYDIDDPDFDAIWQWLGSYETWRAAMSVFLYPETVLRPTLRKLSSPGFVELVDTLRESGRISPAAAKAVLQQYEIYFADVCNLEPVGVYASGLPVRTIFAVAQSSLSGALLFSVWTERPGWGTTGSPDQTPWAYIGWADELNDKQRQGRKKIVSMLPYRDRLAQFSIHIVAQIQLVGQNIWACAQWQAGKATKFAQSDAPPPLMLTEQRASIEADTAEATPAPTWSFSSSDRIAVLGTGQGGPSYLLLYPGLAVGGRRRLGLALGVKASLVLIASEALDENWTVPDFGNPVLMGQRILVANYATSQVGWIDYSNNRLQLIMVQGTIAGPAGNWTVSLANRSQQTAFRAVNLDGGSKRVLAFEYRDPPTSAWLSPVRTFVNVFSFGAAGLRFEHQQDLDLPSIAQPISPSGWAYSPDPDVDGVNWQQVIVLRSGFGPSGSADAQREDVLVHAPVRTEKFNGLATGRGDRTAFYGRTHTVTLEALLRWDSQTNRMVFVDTHWTITQGNAQTIAGASNGWRVDEGDQFLPVRDFSLQTRPYRLAALNSTTKKIGLIDYDSLGRLSTTFLAADDIAGAAGLSWHLAADDALTVARVLHKGADSVLLTNSVSGDFCVLEISANALTPVFTEADYSVMSPSSTGAQQRVKGAEGFHVADIDSDGLDEIVVMPGNPNLVSGVSIWHGLPEPLASSISSPGGVTEFDLSPSDLGTDALQERSVRIRNAYARNQIPGLEQNLLYLDEAYYFVPLEIAVRLTSAGHNEQALDMIRTVFDYEMPGASRFIAYKLVIDSGTPAFNRMADWLDDPLDPHAIASTRSLSYLKYTLLVTIRCLLDYGDREFTYGTAESVNRARELYLKALELLDTPGIYASSAPCADLLGVLETTIGAGEWIWPEVKRVALDIVDRSRFERIVENVRSIMKASIPKPEKLSGVLQALDQAQSDETRTLESVLSSADRIASEITAVALAELPQDSAYRAVRMERGSPFSSDAEVAVEESDITVTEYAMGGLEANVRRMHIRGERRDTQKNPRRKGRYVPAPSPVWCIAPNPQFDALRRHAEANLHKIRNCRNIAGMEVVFDVEAAPSAAQTDLSNIESLGQLKKLVQRPLPPLPYRYATLVDRAKQLVEIARQIEQSMLASLQVEDQKQYELLKAKQDLSLARAGVRLQDLQVIQAGDASRGAELQRDRAQLQLDEYRGRLRAGRSTNEELALGFQAAAATLQTASAVAAWAGIESPKTFFEWAGAVAGPLASSAQAAQMWGSLASLSASLERRDQEWRFQGRLSAQEVQIGNQQFRVAQDQERITAQERVIAGMLADHAAAIVDFLSTGAFGTLALYEWMSGVLEGIYRYFLQQATSIAQMAESQLAFERQQSPPVVIRDDYWTPPETGMSTNFASGAGQAPDVKGLTGSARLLRDIYELDQYAFTTNQRKLQLTETISLAQLDPIAFQQFRKTGTLIFETPMQMFDRKFPGHYLRLIRRVRTSVVALIPASLGIRATLSSSGVSRVVIGPEVFQAAAIRRPPESVALSSAWNATGLFELDVQPELLVPFEGFGVDTGWQFEMPRPANPFDYDNIADVLVTIEYTALNSYDYRQQVLQDMSRYTSADRAFSFRNDFADAWYQLNNPDVCAPPAMTVSFDIDDSDFLPNLEPGSLAIRHIVLYFVPAKGDTVTVAVQGLSFKPAASGAVTISGGPATSASNGIVSTRAGTGGGWISLIGQSPGGTWRLELTDSPALRSLFTDGKIKDVLFVLTYEAQMLPWPQ